MKFSLLALSLCLGTIGITFLPNLQVSNLGNPLDGNYPRFSLISTVAFAKNLASGLVLVYGNPRCGWTSQLIEQLKSEKIPYQFKNLDIQSIRDEWNVLLKKNGVPDGTSIKLPVVLVNGKVFMRPSIEQVITQRQKTQKSSPKIPNGWYIGETNSDASFEVKNNQYCSANLATGLIECSPISELTYIKPGVVRLYQDTYFCSQNLFKIHFGSNSQRYGYCTANGWVWTR